MDEASIYRIEAGSEFVRQYSYRTEPGEPLKAGDPSCVCSSMPRSEETEEY
jgi:hypothetical protein